MASGIALLPPTLEVTLMLSKLAYVALCRSIQLLGLLARGDAPRIWSSSRQRAGTLLHRGGHVAQAERQLRDLVRDLLREGAASGEVRNDVSAGGACELLPLCRRRRSQSAIQGCGPPAGHGHPGRRTASALVLAIPLSWKPRGTFDSEGDRRRSPREQALQEIWRHAVASQGRCKWLGTQAPG